MRETLPAFVRQRLDPAGRFGLRLTLFAIALVVFGVPFGLLLDQVVREGPFLELDTSAANHLHHWARESPSLISVLRFISFLGSPLWFYLLCGAAAVWLLTRGRRRLTAFLVATTLTGGVVDTIVKVVVDRDRPSLESPIATAHGQSFPSGHAMTSTIAYGALLLIFFPLIARGKRVLAAAGVSLLVLAIGFSRLALGVHYVSDVLGGFALGLAWLVASVSAFSIWREERGRRPVEPLRGLEPEAARDLRLHAPAREP